MSRLPFELFDQYIRYAEEHTASTPPDPLSECIDGEQKRQAMAHSFEILRTREGGFDKAALLEKALDIIRSVWRRLGLETSRRSPRC